MIIMKDKIYYVPDIFEIMNEIINQLISVGILWRFICYVFTIPFFCLHSL